ncbi:hypothetical protein [Streptomyces sp. NPDC058086]|uniref:hypothetical protein n=1 Tax=Streptomyces sp. NPDC058086 TaxID=3346334 RepID=UPI0036E58946
MLRGKGMHHNTGTFPNGDTSHPVFEPRDAERDMRVVAKDPHCTAVRGIRGLEVRFSPFPCELTNAEMLPLFTDCAERAERLRRDGAEVTLVTDYELSLFARGHCGSISDFHTGTCTVDFAWHSCPASLAGDSSPVQVACGGPQSCRESRPYP